MTLKPCPNPACRGELFFVRNMPDIGVVHVKCKSCGLVGPSDDPTGEKWNNMLRVEDVAAAFENGLSIGNFDIDRDAGWDYSDTKRDLDRRMGK